MSFDRKAMTDAEFERALLGSAKADAPPHDTASAWTRFASMAGLTVPAPAGDVEEPRSKASSGPTAGGGWASLGPRRGTALKWLLVGAIGGSVVTAALLRQPRRAAGDGMGSSVSVAAPAAVSSSKVDAAVCAPGQGVTESPVAAVAPLTMPGLVHPRRHAKHPATTRPRSQATDGDSGKGASETADETASSASSSASSSLAAEVARIDTARGALAGGDHDRAVRLVEQYHWDFPSGRLAPDADVVALEAVAAKHDRAEVARRGALFLSRYPGDPHAARVMWLIGH